MLFRSSSIPIVQRWSATTWASSSCSRTNCRCVGFMPVGTTRSCRRSFDRHAKSLDDVLDHYWAYYASLQDYRAGPTKELAEKLRLEFDELFSTQTKYAALDDRIAKTAAKKDELLTVLSLPEVPLHNNASELGARVSARRRDVSLHSRSERGVRAMDIFTTLVQTSKKLGISAFAYLRDQIGRASCRERV